MDASPNVSEWSGEYVWTMLSPARTGRSRSNSLPSPTRVAARTPSPREEQTGATRRAYDEEIEGVIIPMIIRGFDGLLLDHRNLQASFRRHQVRHAAQVTELYRELASHSRVIRLLSERADEAEKGIKAADEELLRLPVLMEDAREHNRWHTSRLTDLRGQIDRLEEDSEDKDQEIVNLTEQIEEMKKKGKEREKRAAAAEREANRQTVDYDVRPMNIFLEGLLRLLFVFLLCFVLTIPAYFMMKVLFDVIEWIEK